MKKYRFTFAQQAAAYFGVFVIGSFWARVFHSSLFNNMAWVVCGIMAIVNPVCPEKWYGGGKLPSYVIAGSCIAGAILIYIGLKGSFAI